jgi:hypothetical protein
MSRATRRRALGACRCFLCAPQAQREGIWGQNCSSRLNTRRSQIPFRRPPPPVSCAARRAPLPSCMWPARFSLRAGRAPCAGGPRQAGAAPSLSSFVASFRSLPFPFPPSPASLRPVSRSRPPPAQSKMATDKVRRRSESEGARARAEQREREGSRGEGKPFGAPLIRNPAGPPVGARAGLPARRSAPAAPARPSDDG